MFEIIFGVVWLSIVGICTFGFYSGGADTITVNGQLVTQEEFNAMLGPKIFLGIFWAVGIIMIIVGLRKIIRNAKTDKLGEICYGRIISIFKSGTYINNIPELKALVSVYVESTGTVEDVEEVIGLATKREYNVGDYIEGKYYNGDINITSYIPETMVPSHIQNMFKNVVPEQDTITIDGVEYVKKDSLNLNR